MSGSLSSDLTGSELFGTCKTFNSQDFTKRNLIFFAYFFFDHHFELFSAPSSVYTSKNFYQGFFFAILR